MITVSNNRKSYFRAGPTWSITQTNLNWLKDASCRGMDPNIFFPRKWVHDSVLKAKAICNMCPVKEECLEYALSIPPSQALGIWAGTTERERRTLRRKIGNPTTRIRETD
jgi:WhiB family redox-sensing transcriptional regulator